MHVCFCCVFFFYLLQALKTEPLIALGSEGTLICAPLEREGEREREEGGEGGRKRERETGSEEGGGEGAESGIIRERGRGEGVESGIIREREREREGGGGETGGRERDNQTKENKDIDQLLSRQNTGSDLKHVSVTG